MKTIFKALFFIFLVLLNSRIIYPQWIQTNGPGGGYVSYLASSGNNIIADVFNKGVFLSTNDGTNWTQINNGLVTSVVRSFAFSDNGIFAGTDSGVFITTNTGVNWQQINTGLTTTNVYALAIHVTYIFAGTYGGGIFNSTNNGANWTQVYNGITSSNIYSLSISGDNIFAGSDSGNVFISSN